MEYISGWWFQPSLLKNMKVGWEYHSKYMEKHKMVQTTNQIWISND